MALCVTFVLLALLMLNESMIYSPDSAHYLAWARSLASFDGWHVTFGPEPFRYVVNAPLYPVLLAPVALVAPAGALAGKAVTLLFGALTLFLFYRLVSPPVGATVAGGMGVLLAVNPLFLTLSTQVLSDVPFAACTLLFFILADRMNRDGRTAGATALFIAVICASLFLREVGFALVFAGGAVLFSARRYRALLLFLLSVGLLYGLWYVRNEVVVAGAEQPALRNLRLITSHVYTGPGTTIGDELAARAGTASRFYGGAVGTIMFASQDQDWVFSLVRPTDPVLAAVDAVMPFARLPLTVLTAALCLAGINGFRRTGHSVVAIAVFSLAYAGILLLYPISDVRFLFPVLLLMVWLAALGLRRIRTGVSPRTRRFVGPAFALILAIAAIPNAAWVSRAIATNLEYWRSPRDFAARCQAEEGVPNELTLIRRPAATWVASNTASTSVVVCRFADAGLWLGGRPLLTPSPLATIDDFDLLLRDYGAEYLIAAGLGGDVRDFDTQMAFSRRFRFVPVYSFGDTEVLRVEQKRSPNDPSIVNPPSSDVGARSRLFGGLRALQSGDYGSAAAAFHALNGVRGMEIPAAFFTALTEECLGHLDSAEFLFRQFRAIPQAAQYIQQAQYHEEIISLLRQAAREDRPSERASIYHTISLDYWLLGLRHQAETMVQNALRADPRLFIGHVFAGLYALADGDTAAAAEHVANARKIRPHDDITRGLSAAMAAMDSLHSAPHPAAIELAIGRQYVSLGLFELGIDQALKALAFEPENAEALRVLADLYARKHRNAPALAARRRLARLVPHAF